MRSSSSHLLQYFFSGLLLALFVAGCGRTESDSNHESSHSHEHDHSHHQSEPRFGGEMVEVGHTHHPDGLLFYFAEVLPVKDNSITFYLSVEDEAGKSSWAKIAETEVLAYVSDIESETTVSREMTFKLQEDSNAMTLFAAQIPTSFINSRTLSIVVPKLTLGAERLNFTFEINNQESLQSDHVNDSSDATSDTKEETESMDEEQK